MTQLYIYIQPCIVVDRHHCNADPDPVPYSIFYFEGCYPDLDHTLSAVFRIGKCLRTKPKLILTKWSSDQAFLKKYSLYKQLNFLKLCRYFVE
jgi:hypothetical protein